MKIDLDRLAAAGVPNQVDESRSQLIDSLNRASYRNPSQEAEIRDLSQKKGMHPDVVEQELGEIKRQEKLSGINVEGLLVRNPATVRYFKDESNAAISINDVDGLRMFEDLMTPWHDGLWDTIVEGGKKLGYSAELAARDYHIGNLQRSVEMADVRLAEEGRTGEEIAQLNQRREGFQTKLDKQRYFKDFLLRDIEESNKAIGEATPDDLGFFATYTRSGIESLARNLPVILAATVLKSPNVASMLGGADVGVSSYGEARAEGMEPDEAAVYGVLQGTIERATEKLALTKLGDLYSGKSTIGKGIADFIATEIVSEQFATLGQTAVDLGFGMDEELGGELSEGRYGDALATQLERQAGTVVATAVGGGPMAALGGAGNYYSRRAEDKLTKEFSRVIQSTMEQDSVDKLISLAQSNETKGLSPERLKQYLDDAADGKSWIVSREALEEAAKQGVELPDSIVTLMQNDTDPEVSIPVSEILINEELTEAVRSSVKWNDESLSQNEMANISETMQAIVNEAEESANAVGEEAQIQKELAEKLIATRRVRQHEAPKMAALVSSYANARGKVYGLSPREVFKRMGLDIATPSGRIIKTEGEKLRAATAPSFEPSQNLEGIELQEDRTIAETGETITMKQDAQKLWDNTQKKRNLAQKLAECMNA